MNADPKPYPHRRDDLDGNAHCRCGVMAIHDPVLGETWGRNCTTALREALDAEREAHIQAVKDAISVRVSVDVLDGTVAGLIVQRDAALTRIAELEATLANERGEGEPPRERKAAHPARHQAEHRSREVEAARQLEEVRQEERITWPDGYPTTWEPMSWYRMVSRIKGTQWIFSGVDPRAFPPRTEDARIVERAPHFRWEVGADEWTYDAGYARSLGVAMRRAEDAYRECWPELVAEFEAKAKAPPAKPKEGEL